MVDRIQENLATFQQNGGNWKFTRIVRLEIRTAKYNPLAARGFIRLPKYLTNKGAVINPQNENGDDCFKWCITRHFHPVQKTTTNNKKNQEKRQKSINGKELISN